MKLSDGLFLDCFRRVAEDYPDIAADDRIVDAACMRLVVQPESFDVLLTMNLYGDIVSDLAAGLVGGLGVVPGANLGATAAVFEAVHGTAPDIAGKGAANPTALLLSAILMLEHLELPEHARRIRAAMLETIASGVVTPDLGGTATTSQYAKAIAQRLS
jgi:isocitrate dehydrogenase (NAD+)